jgi:hypothetical protein
MPSPIAGAAPVEDPVANFKPSALTVAITVHEASVEGRRRILVDFEFKNPTSKDEHLERWLALEPREITLALLRILMPDGSPIPYIGRHFNRGHHIGVESYLRIAAGGTRVVRDVDATAVYDWPPTPQRLTVRYEAFTMSHGTLRLLRSSNQSLDYVPPTTK